MKKEVGKVLVGIIMGSNSDLNIMQEAATILNSFSVPNELKVVSAHRTVKRMIEYATHAHERGMKVIIAGAGGSAHLPGMVARHYTSSSNRSTRKNINSEWPRFPNVNCTNAPWGACCNSSD